MKENKKIITLGLIVFVILLLVGLLTKSSLEGILFDKVIMDYIHSNTSSAGISIMKIISMLGSPILFLSLGLFAFLYFWKNKKIRKARLILLSIGGSYILNASIKTIFSRSRPIDYMLIEQGGHSFPSGHSMVSMSFYTTLTYILLENIKGKRKRNLIWVGNFILVGLIGFSRIYLGVHWPTDVIMGYGLGFTFFIISKALVKE